MRRRKGKRKKASQHSWSLEERWKKNYIQAVKMRFSAFQREIKRFIITAVEIFGDSLSFLRKISVLV